MAAPGLYRRDRREQSIMKIDGEFLELLAGCPRTILFGLTGQLMIIMICDRLLVRHRSIWRLWFGLIIKLVFSTVFVGTVLQHYYPDSLWIDFLGVASNLCLLIICYAILAQTYYGGILKCIIAEIIGEFITTVIMLPCSILNSFLENRENLFVVYGVIKPAYCLGYLFMILMAAGFCRLTDPLLKKFRSCRIRHPKLTASVMIFIIGTMQLMSLGDVQDGETVVVLFYLLFLIYAVTFLLVLFLIYGNRRQYNRMESIFLNMQLHLLESHYTSLRKQMQNMEQCQRIIDSQMKEIEKGKTISEGQAASYLESLRKEYSKLRAGMYCNDWIVDAVLYCESEKARSQGIGVECSLMNYDRGKIPEYDLARLLYWLLDYGIRVNQDMEKETKKGKQILLRMGTVRDCLAIELDTAAGKKKTPSYKQLRSSVKACDGTLVTEILGE